MVILGDLNADCSYLSKTKMANIYLRNDPAYKWLIGDDADTTVGRQQCAYDRYRLINQNTFIHRINIAVLVHVASLVLFAYECVKLANGLCASFVYRV